MVLCGRMVLDSQQRSLQEKRNVLERGCGMSLAAGDRHEKIRW